MFCCPWYFELCYPCNLLYLRCRLQLMYLLTLLYIQFYIHLVCYFTCHFVYLDELILFVIIVPVNLNRTLKANPFFSTELNRYLNLYRYLISLDVTSYESTLHVSDPSLSTYIITYIMETGIVLPSQSSLGIYHVYIQCSSGNIVPPSTSLADLTPHTSS